MEIRNESMSHIATHQTVAGLHLVYISIYKFWPSYRAALAEQQDAALRGCGRVQVLSSFVMVPLSSSAAESLEV